ncbi:MAG: hypothetical protein QXY45_03075 [Candidatus Aenigmatarchaeota archaeon]
MRWTPFEPNNKMRLSRMLWRVKGRKSVTLLGDIYDSIIGLPTAKT